MKIEIKGGGSKPEYLHIFSKFKDYRDIKYFMHRTRPSRRLRNLLKGRKYLFRFYTHEFTFELHHMQSRVKKLHYWTCRYKHGPSLRHFTDPAFKDDKEE